MKSFRQVIFVLLLSFANSVSYARYPQVSQFLNHKRWNFTENKGQLTDGKGTLLRDIKYYGSQGGANVFCKPGKISFVFTKVKNENIENTSEATGMLSLPSVRDGDRGWKNRGPNILTSRISSSAYGPAIALATADFILINSNPSAHIVASDRLEYYENFYTSNAADKEITNVHTYKTIIYQNVYPNIDFILHTRENGMEYEFLVRPGGKISDIQMQWNGIDKIERLKDSRIEYSFSFGTIKESEPVSFQSGHEIPSRFNPKGSFTGLRAGRYDHSKNLLIDPVLDWSTYYGGEGDEVAHAMAVDMKGNNFVTGKTYSMAGIASAGAFLTVNYDTGYYSKFIGVAFLAKFSPSGNRLWGTYYGSFGNAVANGITIDRDGNAVIDGFVSTPDSGIATPGAYQTSQTPDSSFTVQAFVAKFSPGGSRVWGTYFGNHGIGTCISADSADNIIIAGTTVDSGMGTAGVFRSDYSYVQDSLDMFIAKISATGIKTWLTYFGGHGQEDELGLSRMALDPAGNIFLVGTTTSYSGIASAGAFQTERGYTFLAKFTSTGGLDWSTYFGKGNGDNIYGVAADAGGNVVITGGFSNSYIDSGMATSGAYQTSFSTMYVAKFSPAGGRIWCTYYGRSSNGQTGGLAIDNNNDIFLTGQIGRPGMPFWLDSGIATTGAYQTDYMFNGQKAFLTEFSPSGEVRYATYFGGDTYVDTYGDVVCAFSPGIVYLLGTTSSSNDIATSGAYQTSFAGGNLTYGYGDAFIAKFDFDKSGVENSHAVPISFSLYPNPANDHIILNASGLSYRPATCSVYDILGNKVNTYMLYPVSGTLNQEINVTGYTKGVYYLELVQEGKRYVQKLVVE